MTLLIRDLRLGCGEPESLLLSRVAKRLRIEESDIDGFQLRRKSLDARKKSDIHYNCAVALDCAMQDALLSKGFDGVKLEVPFHFQAPVPGNEKLPHRPVVVGAGPCGLFAAFELAKMGYAPVLLERGKPICQRCVDVERLFKGGNLEADSNALFGQGGAGAFSDGKLTARGKDPRSRLVLKALNECGAPDSVLFEAKPHIGTDVLREVIANLSSRIAQMGGTILYEAKVEGLRCANGALTALKTTAGEVAAEACIMAIGHSARDTYDMLLKKGVAMSPKPFAVGVRIEHPQELIDEAQYGDASLASALGAAEYALTANCNGRGVYTFCMCPGGYVVCSASEAGELAVNGMSYHARDGRNANSAVVVQVRPDDFGAKPLDGVEFQRRIETAAYLAGGGKYAAPVQTVDAFLAKKAQCNFRSVLPSYRPGYMPADLNDVLPAFIAGGIEAALPQFGRKLKGFDMRDAVLTGVETRTSAPVRLLRSSDGQSENMRGLYPAGEGSGYAGGIVSAAIDGIRAAWAVIDRFAPPKA